MRKSLIAMVIAAMFQADARYVSMHLDTGPERFPKQKRATDRMRSGKTTQKRILAMVRSTKRHR